MNPFQLSPNSADGKAGEQSSLYSNTIVYTVQPGDCICSIASKFGFSWQTIWNLPANEPLRNRRNDPNVLRPGDRLIIPRQRLRNEFGKTETRHQFRLQGRVTKLRLRLLTAKKRPRMKLRFSLQVSDFTHEGTTDDTGRLEVSIPPTAERGQLVLQTKRGPERYELEFGKLDPSEEGVKGIQQRLINLGYLQNVSDALDEETRESLQHFQEDEGMEPSGELDNSVRKTMRKIHGC